MLHKLTHLAGGAKERDNAKILGALSTVAIGFLMTFLPLLIWDIKEENRLLKLENERLQLVTQVNCYPAYAKR